jgi:hypothetical protein
VNIWVIAGSAICNLNRRKQAETKTILNQVLIENTKGEYKQ